MSEMNVYSKLANARCMLQEKKLKKSGTNKFSGFDYFELSDFLPSINAIFNQVGLCSQFSITHKTTNEDTGVVDDSVAKLKIINSEKPDEVVEFETPLAEANMKGASAIQQLGAMHTYLRRYLWLMAMEICEHDEIDGTSGKEAKTAPKADTKPVQTAPVRKLSPKQIQIITGVYEGENLQKLLAKNNLAKLEDMPMVKAEELIKELRQKGKIA